MMSQQLREPSSHNCDEHDVKLHHIYVKKSHIPNLDIPNAVCHYKVPQANGQK